MKKKVLLITAAVILTVSILIGGAVFVFSAFIMDEADFETDDALFSAAKRSGGTTYYAFDEKGDAVAVYRRGDALKREWRSFDEIGENLKNGFISAEDREFYSHNGVNLRRSIVALVNHVFKISSGFGASTITQQVVKNISGDNERTAKRKAAEILRAMHLETEHSKEDILELYMNIVPMSENIYGVTSASNIFFGKMPDELTLAEAATIVGITNSPSRYNPYRHPEECKAKRNRVLYAMLDNGAISREEYSFAVNEPLIVCEKSEKEFFSSWFIETVNDDAVKQIANKYKVSEGAARVMLDGGVKIYTTMNPKVQRALEDFFEDEQNLPEQYKDGLDVSMAVYDSVSGDLAGIIGRGGKKSGERLLNLATVPRTPGSVLKPLALYAPLLDRKKINWATVFDDIPISVTENEGDIIPYPKNSPDVYDGLVTVKDAIRLSKNTVAVRLYEVLGKNRIFKILREDYGIDSLIDRKTDKDGNVITDMDMSPLALGQLSYGITLRKLTECYTAFPGDGVLRGGRSFVRIETADGGLLIENESESKRVMNEETARIMNQLLMCVTDDGTAKRITLKNLVDTAGKTGTSGGSRDKLFVGYTPYYTAGIWCGYPAGGKSVDIGSAHISMWDRVMKNIHQETVWSNSDNVKTFSVEGIVKRQYCMDSGDLPDIPCRLDPRGARIEFGYFTEDNMPHSLCKTHVLCYENEQGDLLYEGGGQVTDGKETARLRIKRELREGIHVTDEKYVVDREEIKQQMSQADLPRREERKKKKRRIFGYVF